MTGDIIAQLERRLGRLHARLRLGIEADYEAHVFGPGIKFFHLENWYSIHSFIKNGLRLLGLYGRGRRNTLDIQVRHNDIAVRGLPPAFEGYTLLHLSDPHVDMNWAATQAMIERVRDLEYDVCVLTGDYRARTFGPFDETLRGMQLLRTHLREPVFGVLGNHDTIRMVPGLEAMGIRMLLNEAVALTRDGAAIHLIGVDDPHFYRADNIEKAAGHLSHDDVWVLLSHTPEIYRHAAHAGVDVMLCGHTHGGQICLPGGWPLTLDADCPRRFGAGPWSYHAMQGYTSTGAGTSIVSVRFNCPPEIALHHLHAA